LFYNKNQIENNSIDSFAQIRIYFTLQVQYQHVHFRSQRLCSIFS